MSYASPSAEILNCATAERLLVAHRIGMGKFSVNYVAENFLQMHSQIQLRLNDIQNAPCRGGDAGRIRFGA